MKKRTNKYESLRSRGKVYLFGSTTKKHFVCFLPYFGNIFFNKAALVSLGEEDIGKEGVFYTDMYTATGYVKKNGKKQILFWPLRQLGRNSLYYKCGT